MAKLKSYFLKPAILGKTKSDSSALLNRHHQSHQEAGGSTGRVA